MVELGCFVADPDGVVKAGSGGSDMADTAPTSATESATSSPATSEDQDSGEGPLPAIPTLTRKQILTTVLLKVRTAPSRAETQIGHVGDNAGFADNELLFGFDPTEHIVAVEFAPPDIAVVFIRQPDGTTKVTRERFRPFAWQESEPGVLKARHFANWRSLPRGKGAGGHDRVLADPANQYLLGSGRTLFKEMAFEDLRRMQIDLETATSLGYEFSVPERDRLLAIAVADSSGWEELIVIEDDFSDSERRAIERLCRLIAERDPDVIEGHNFFKFDLAFLAERSRRLGVRLTFGRNGSRAEAR